MELIETIKSIHQDCYKLCNQALGKYIENAGNIGIFCHSDQEYTDLTKLRQELTHPSDNPSQKYFTLRESIIIPAIDDVPGATYQYLYIRQPDPTPYGQYNGDIDFVLPNEEYQQLKNSLLQGKQIPGAEIYDRPGWDNIELTDPDIKSVAFVSTKAMAEKVRIKFD